MGILKNWLHKQTLKNRLIEVFVKAGLYVDHQTRGGKVPIYPKIHDISSSKEKVRYIFTIPNGLIRKPLKRSGFAFNKY